MSEAAAVIPVVSAPIAPAFDPSDQHTWSPEQRDQWNKDGNIPEPVKQESAPVEKKEAPVAESAPQKESKEPAAVEPEEKPQEYKARTEKRFTDILATVKRLETELAEARKPRDDKAAPQTAAKPDEFKPLNAEEWFKANPGKSYEQFAQALAEQIADYKIDKALAGERQRLANESQQRELSQRLEDAKQRYPEAEPVINRTATTLNTDAEIPQIIKAVIANSKVMVDLLYVLGGDEAKFQDFVKLTKTNPHEALEQVYEAQRLVKVELAGKAKADPTKEAARDDKGKFVKAEIPETPTPRAPKPPSEIGGKGSAPEDVQLTAAAANDFRAFEAEENRRKFAS